MKLETLKNMNALASVCGITLNNSFVSEDKIMIGNNSIEKLVGFSFTICYQPENKSNLITVTFNYNDEIIDEQYSTEERQIIHSFLGTFSYKTEKEFNDHFKSRFINDLKKLGIV